MRQCESEIPSTTVTRPTEQRQDATRHQECTTVAEILEMEVMKEESVFRLTCRIVTGACVSGRE